MDRRDFCLSLSALAAVAQITQIAEAQSTASGTDAASIAAGTSILAHNHIFRASEMPIKQTATGSSQQVLHGVLPTGEGIEMHNTVLNPGHEPHPPHQHPHAEFLFLTAGNVDWLIGEGAASKRQTTTAGDIVYAASGVLHGLRNVGTVPAKYFVLAIGPNLAHGTA